MKHDIAELDLSVRSYNCLKRAGIHYIEDIPGKTDDELLAIQWFGVKCLYEVREKVAGFCHVPTYDELDDQVAALVGIVRDMVTDYMCCADHYHGLNHRVVKGGGSVYDPDATSILDRIRETYDGLKIKRYLDKMKEIGYEL